MKVILASTSPQRRELLALLGIPFEVRSPLCHEWPSGDIPPSEQAKQFALDKAQSIAAHFPHDLVLGSDTVIETNDTLLGKPADLKEAEVMLRHLRGHDHFVHTGLALIHKASDLSMALVDTARVWIHPFTEDELQRYLNTKESLGKAGGYSIQGEGAKLIEKIEGDYTTIVGLPLWQAAKLLEGQGVKIRNSLEEIYRLKPFANWAQFD